MEEIILNVLSDFRSSTHCLGGDEDMPASLSELLSSDDLASLEDELLSEVYQQIKEAEKRVAIDCLNILSDCHDNCSDCICSDECFERERAEEVKNKYNIESEE